MSNKRQPQVRIAVVKYSPGGSTYVARCPRRDIDVGARVWVLKRDSLWLQAQVAGIQHERWACGDEVRMLDEEMEFEFDL